MELQRMPNEVLRMIASQLTSKRDLATLCLVSKAIQATARPILYQSISLGPEGSSYPEEWAGIGRNIFDPFLVCFDAGRLISACVRGRLHDTQSLVIRAPFYADGHPDASRRCYHNLGKGEQHFENQIAINLLTVLQACQENRLRSFSWEAGVCPPQAILGPSGYLAENQKHLASIRLITYGNCTDMAYHPGVPSLALRSFPCLKELSWAGLSTHEYDALAPALRQCAPRLTKLELDLEWHIYLTEDDIVGGGSPRALPFFSKKVLRLHRPGSLVFPALKSLSLSNVVLDSHDFAIARSIDFSNLEHLQLRFCPGTERVLQHLAASGSNKLRTLEINIGYSYLPLPEIEQQTIWIAFLESFQGLEELYINMWDEAAGLTTDIWRAVGRHRKTLRKFGYHQRQHFTGAYGDEEETWDAFGDDGVTVVDALNLGLSETVDLEGDGSNNPLCHLDLRGLGLGCSPKWMMPIVSPFCHKSSLQLLHMRRSGLDSILEDPDRSSIGLPIYKAADFIRSELHPFLQWVFGPRGIRSLRLFVYGDFSHGDRYRRYWKVMCRNEAPEAAAAAGDAETRLYREVTEDDQGLLGLLKEHEGLVSALPNDGLFGGYHPDSGGAH